MSNDEAPANPPPAQPPARVSGARAHLEARAGPEKGETFRVAPRVTVIGRDPSCEVTLTETAISRQHCRIERQGEQWILRNLSSNGTRIKRKEIEEHVLSDGDEIRIGAKTRLEFVVEEVARPTGGRPQFRPRTAEGEPEEAAPEAETREEEEEQAPSLFERRKGLFIGLGVYLGLVVIGGLVGVFYLKGCQPAQHGAGGIPRLSRNERIIPAGWSKPLMIDRSSTTGIWCVTETGEQVLVPHEDLASGKARRVSGIREAIDVDYLTIEEFDRRVRRGEISPRYPYVLRNKKSRRLAEQYKRQAIEAYLVSDMPGNERQLFTAVRLFQRAMAHYGLKVLPNPKEDEIRQNATKKLINKVCNLYDQAIIQEKSGDYRSAISSYEKILAYVPEEENIIFRNVSARLGEARRRLREKER